MPKANKLTIYYNLKTLNIQTISMGEQSLDGYKGLAKEDAELIFGILIIDYDDFIFKHTKLFELYKDENNEIQIRLNNNYKKDIMKYL